MAAKAAPASMVWSTTAVTGFVPPSRTGHSASHVGDFIYIFGGMQAGVRVNTVVAYDTVRKSWSRVSTSGTKPCPRSEHAAWVVESKIYVQGGETGGLGVAENIEVEAALAPSESHGELKSVVSGKTLLTLDAAHKRQLLDDLFVLDTETFAWSQVHTRLAPLPRKAHTSTLLESARGSTGRAVITFGGMSSGLGEPLDEVLTLDLDTLGTWKAMWLKAELTGSPPAARFGHTSTAISDHSLVVFGGATSGTTFLNDTHLLDMNKLTWNRVSCRGLPPSARYGHASTLVPGRPPHRPPTMLVFGGVSLVHDEQHFPKDLHALDLVNRQWSVVRVGFMFPSPRFGHSMSLIVPCGNLDVTTSTIGGVRDGSLPPRAITAHALPRRASNGTVSAPVLPTSTSRKWPSQTPISPSASEAALPHALDSTRSPSAGYSHEFREATKTEDSYFIVFGGQNTMYCTSDVWKLRVRRKSTFIYKVEEDGESSGSDAEEHHDERTLRAAGALVEAYGYDEPEERSYASGTPRVAAAGSEPIDASLEEAIMSAKKDKLKMERQLTREIAARQAAEKERNEMQALLKVASAQLATTKQRQEATVAKVRQECAHRVEEANARARQARADLQRVVHVLCLHDLASNLRLELVKRRAWRGSRGPAGSVASEVDAGTSAASVAGSESRASTAARPVSAVTSRDRPPSAASRLGESADVFEDYAEDDEDYPVKEGQL